MEWKGSTNANGELLIPGHVVQHSMYIFVTGYSAADLYRQATTEANGGWGIALDADRPAQDLPN